MLNMLPTFPRRCDGDIYSSLEELTESGSWLYVTLLDLLPRTEPSSKRKALLPLSKKIAEGTLVHVIARTFGDGSKKAVYLQLEDLTWLCEGECNGKSLLQKVEMKTGKWRYRVVFPTGVAVRGRPSMTKPQVTDVLPCGQIAMVDALFRVGEVTYLHLADGENGCVNHGWIFDRRVKDASPVCEFLDTIEDGKSVTGVNRSTMERMQSGLDIRAMAAPALIRSFCASYAELTGLDDHSKNLPIPILLDMTPTGGTQTVKFLQRPTIVHGQSREKGVGGGADADQVVVIEG